VSLFGILFPREAARLSLNTKRVAELMDLAGLDDSSRPELSEVIREIRAGHDIKAAQLYSQVMGVGVGESHLAVSDIKSRLGT
jgi:hypothetical protein